MIGERANSGNQGQPIVGMVRNMELCCFCRAEICSATHKKKRKLLHRDACADARSRLSAFLTQRRGKGIEAFEETSCSTALLCFQCIGELDRLETLQRSFQDLHDLVGSRADSLVLLELPPTPVASKRSATKVSLPLTNASMASSCLSFS